jgi:hypothetical protein
MKIEVCNIFWVNKLAIYIYTGDSSSRWIRIPLVGWMYNQPFLRDKSIIRGFNLPYLGLNHHLKPNMDMDLDMDTTLMAISKSRC